MTSPKTNKANPKIKKNSTLDRKEIISQSSIKSPRDSRMSKRRLKLTDTERKQVNKDLQIIKKSSASDHEIYESERYDIEDPESMNAVYAAEMGIDYPPSFDKADESENKYNINFKREIGNADLKSPVPVEQHQVEFNKVSKSSKHRKNTPSIADISGKSAVSNEPVMSPKKSKNVKKSEADESYNQDLFEESKNLTLKL